MKIHRSAIRMLLPKFGLIILVLAELGAPAIAKEPLLAEFIGDWQSSSDTNGQPTNRELSWTPVLDGQFVRVDYVIRKKDALDGKPSFSGVAYYEQTNANTLTAFWADTSGDLHPVHATINGNILVSIWGKAGEKLGRTQYEITDDRQMIVTDWLLTSEGWQQFDRNSFTMRKPVSEYQPAQTKPVENANINEGDTTMEKVTGIGGIFFRAKETGKVSKWYADNLGINLPPSDYESQPWIQDAGPTVFSPFQHDTDYFGDPDQQWMINFRVRDLDGMVEQLRKNGNEVEVDAETYPNGRFARTQDPEGTPIQLWEPAK